MVVIKAGGKKPHVLVVPYQAQGHVLPLMKLCHKIANSGIKVTFLLTESLYRKVVAAMSSEADAMKQNTNPIQVFSVNNRDDDGNYVSFRRVMTENLTGLVEKINNNNAEDEKITCVLADLANEWIFNVTQKMGLESVVFRASGAAGLALNMHIPQLIQANHLDVNGSVTKNDGLIELSEDIPLWTSHEPSWSIPDDLTTQKKVFEGFLAAGEVARNAKWLLGNTFYELEMPACNLIPTLLPVGPFLAHHNESNSSIDGNFRKEDMTCLTWLDEQLPDSVIYISFGSTAIFSQEQLNELALALQLSGRPFLWVIRSDMATNGSNVKFPNGFQERVVKHGKIVEWAPQEKVLAHSALSCFLTHCGWNSAVESLCMGVPLLCWPYFMDQFHNEKYICDVWKIGLRLNPDENGIRSRNEIKNKIEMLLSDQSIKANAMKLKEIARETLSESGSSYQNFKNLSIT